MGPANNPLWSWALMLPPFGLLFWGVLWLIVSGARYLFRGAQRWDLARVWSRYYGYQRDADAMAQHDYNKDPKGKYSRPNPYGFQNEAYIAGNTDDAKRELLARACMRIFPVYATLALLIIGWVLGAAFFLIILHLGTTT